MRTEKKNLVYLLIFSKKIFHIPKHWKHNWTYGKHIGYKVKNFLLDNISSTSKHILFNDFNNMKVSLKIIGTSPVTTCTHEKSFSAMRRLKSHARSTMVSKRLNGIALMHVREEIVPDIEKVIDLSYIKHKRLLHRMLSLKVLT